MKWAKQKNPEVAKRQEFPDVDISGHPTDEPTQEEKQDEKEENGRIEQGREPHGFELLKKVYHEREIRFTCPGWTSPVIRADPKRCGILL